MLTCRVPVGTGRPRTPVPPANPVVFGSSIRRQAHSINVRHREAPLIKISHEEEPISLGVLELFLDDSPRIRQFLLVQRVRFIRGRRQNRVRVKRGRS